MKFGEAMSRIPGLQFENSEYFEIETLYKTCLSLGQADTSNAFIEKQGKHTTIYLYSDKQLIIASQNFVEGKDDPLIEIKWHPLSKLSSWNLQYKHFKFSDGTALRDRPSFELVLKFGQDEIQNKSTAPAGARALYDIFKENIVPQV